jgi:hypothetical protein
MAEEEAKKIMANIPIDRDKLREHIRKLPGESLLVFLDRAVDMLPDSKLPRLIKDYIRPSDLLTDKNSDKGLLNAVRAFHKASLPPIVLSRAESGDRARPVGLHKSCWRKVGLHR